MGSCGASEDGVGWGERGENGMGSNGVGTGLDIHTPLYHSDLPLTLQYITPLAIVTAIVITIITIAIATVPFYVNVT